MSIIRFYGFTLLLVYCIADGEARCSDIKEMAEKHGFQNLSVPGFQNIFLNDQTLSKRLILIFIIIVFSGLSIFQIVERVSYYMTEPTLISYEFKVQSKLRFPSISICPQNSLDGPSVNEEMTRRNVSNIYQLLNSGMTLENLWLLSGNNFSNSIVKCRYGAVFCYDPNLWELTYTVLGVCYAYHFKEYVPYSGFISSFIATFVDSKTQARVVIHDITSDISYTAYGRGIPLYPLTAVTIYYIHREVSYVNTSHRPCIETDIYNRCLLDCYDKEVLKNRTCRLPFIPASRSNLTLCSTPEEFETIYPFPLNENAVKIATRAKCCKKNCGKPCVTNQYDITVDSRNTRPGDQTKLIVTPLREGTDSFQERRAYYLDALFCDIGAILGFYLGLSFLTLIEFLELLYFLIIEKRN